MPVRTRSTCRACVTSPRCPLPGRTTGPFGGTTARTTTGMAYPRRPIPATASAAPGHRAGARRPARRYLGPSTPVRSFAGHVITGDEPDQGPAGHYPPPGSGPRGQLSPTSLPPGQAMPPRQGPPARARRLSDRRSRRHLAQRSRGQAPRGEVLRGDVLPRMPRRGRLRAGKAFAAWLRRLGGSPIVRSPIAASPADRSPAGRWPTGCHRSLTCWRRHRVRTTRGHRVARPDRPAAVRPASPGRTARAAPPEPPPPRGSSHRPDRTCCPSPAIRPWADSTCPPPHTTIRAMAGTRRPADPTSPRRAGADPASIATTDATGPARPATGPALNPTTRSPRETHPRAGASSPHPAWAGPGLIATTPAPAATMTCRAATGLRRPATGRA